MSHKRSHDSASDGSASSPARIGPDPADTTVQSQAKKPRFQRYPGRFPGAFYYDTLRTGPKPFGDDSWHLPPVADGDQPEINIFAGAEVRWPPEYRLNPNFRPTDCDGGVAVVCSHVRETQMAWYLFPAIGWEFCQALAIVEAIQQANLELRTATNHEGIGATSSRPFKVKIHSESEAFFKRIEKETLASRDAPVPHLQQPDTAPRGSGEAPSMHSAQEELDMEAEKERLMKDLVERAIKAAEQLQKLPGGLEVELEMHCVEPNDLPVEHNRMHFDANRQLAHYRAKTQGGDTFTVDDVDFKPQQGFWASLKSPLLVSPADRLALALAPPKPPSTVMGGWGLVDQARDVGNSRQLQDLEQRERELDRREAAILDMDVDNSRQLQDLEERERELDRREAAIFDRGEEELRVLEAGWAARDDREVAAVEREWAHKDREAAAEARHAAADDRQAAADDRQAAADYKQAAAKDREEAAEARQAAAEDKQAAADDRQAAADYKQAAAKDREEAAEAMQSATEDKKISAQERLVAMEETNMAMKEHAMATEAHSAAMAEKMLAIEAQNAMAHERTSLTQATVQLEARAQALAEREQAFEAQLAKKENDRLRRQEEEEAAQTQEDQNERTIWNEVFQLRQRALASSEDALTARQQGSDAHTALEEKARALWKDVLQTTEQALAVREASLRAKELRAQAAREKDELSNWNDMLQDKERTLLARGQVLMEKEEALAARESRLEAREAQLLIHQG